MKNNLLKFVGIAAIALLATSCKKENPGSNALKPNLLDKVSPSTSLTTTTDVYVGGFYNLNGVNNSVVQYWLNAGSPTVLTSSTLKHTFNDIAISGSDVYILGNESTTSGFTPKYWVNGLLVTLPSVSGSVYSVATAIAISGGNVYVAGSAAYSTPSGYYQSRLVLWTNGVPAVIGASTYSTEPCDLVIAGSDIYITGGKRAIGSGPYTSVYWKNGVENTLPSGDTNGVFAAVSGSDVYTAAVISGGASFVVWKNGVATTGYTGGPDITQSGISIATSGSDVYIALNGRETATGYNNNVYLWKNAGTPTVLYSAPYSGTSSTPSYAATPKGLAVSSLGDVYLLGYSTISNHGYWKNGVFTAIAKPTTTGSQGIALREY